MASLNWALIDSSSSRPIPLPHEKPLLHLSSVSLSLFPSHPGQSTSKPLSTDTHYTSEKGDVYLSNQRVVYVSPPTPNSGSSGAAHSFETLSVPYSHFRDGHLHQPWLGANYYQAICLPAREGGLTGPHVIKLTFKEGGGFDFYSTVLEMRERLGNRAEQTGEDLPLYTPPNASTSTSTPPAPPSRTQSSSSSTIPSAQSSIPRQPQARQMPSESDLNAASIAREAEEQEETQRSVVATGLASHGGSGGERSDPPPIGDDAPPGYTA